MKSAIIGIMIRTLSFLCFFLFLNVFQANAQTITQTQALSFGTIAIDNLTDNVRINIRNDGTCNNNGNTFMVEPCSRGEFTLTGGPPNSTYTVTTPASTTLSGPGPATFLMDNFRVRPNNLTTNASGTDTFRIMARIQSTLGDTFGDGNYSDTFNITINF